MHIAGTTAVHPCRARSPSTMAPNISSGRAKSLIHMGNRAPAEFPGSVTETRVIKGLRAVRSGYQQSYPQKLWISPKPSENQALGG
ncbi:hypothetical protein [Paracidovorax cattleyae]|nr:hypothetical protein [Paracidovorax cattleyae]MBF9267299.1 hypothetical protein [Paracidovorax cattleyae]